MVLGWRGGDELSNKDYLNSFPAIDEILSIKRQRFPAIYEFLRQSEF